TSSQLSCTRERLWDALRKANASVAVALWATFDSGRRVSGASHSEAATADSSSARFGQRHFRETARRAQCVSPTKRAHRILSARGPEKAPRFPASRAARYCSALASRRARARPVSRLLHGLR